MKSGTHKTSSLFCLLAVMMFSLSSCKFNSNYQGRGDDGLQGSWIEESVPYEKDLLHYSLHEFEFTCDSVYITIKTFAKSQILPDPCYQQGTWKEYAKGVYIIRGDSLLIEATYTHENWKQKLTGCYHIGQYLPHFKIIKQTTDSLYLENRHSHIPTALRKTKTTTCIPKIVY